MLYTSQRNPWHMLLPSSVFCHLSLNFLHRWRRGQKGAAKPRCHHYNSSNTGCEYTSHTLARRHWNALPYTLQVKMRAERRSRATLPWIQQQQLSRLHPWSMRAKAIGTVQRARFSTSLRPPCAKCVRVCTPLHRSILCCGWVVCRGTPG